MSHDLRREDDQITGVALPELRQRAIGHDGARDTILSELAAGRLPGAFLLHGPRGIGKATLAFEMARSIFSATGDETAEHIGAQVAAGSYPNLFVLRPSQDQKTGKFSKFIQVGQVRDQSEQMRHTRGRSGHRIAVVDSIDDCNANAANALLKILEEPPPDTLFFLISHRPGGLLPTIRSRCRPLAMRPLSTSEIETILMAEGIAAEEAAQASALAGGRPRRAFEALSIDADGVLGALQSWLRAPHEMPQGSHLALAETIGGSFGNALGTFARDMIVDAIAVAARNAATQSTPDRARLASANALWEKAQLLLDEIDTLNLDARRGLIVLFDLILSHLSPTPAET